MAKMVQARVYNSADLTIPTATTTALTFNSERYDTDNIHSTASNSSRLTCQTAGKYHIHGQIVWASNTTGVRLAWIILNGTTTIAGISKTPQAGGFFTSLEISTDYELAIGDYVELKVHQTSGGNLAVKNDVNASPEFMMHRMG